jgi:single-strand DNA-binding protein
LEGILKDREIEEVIEGVKSSTESLKLATSMKRLSKIEATDDPSDGADDEYRRQVCRWTA